MTVLAQEVVTGHTSYTTVYVAVLLTTVSGAAGWVLRRMVARQDAHATELSTQSTALAILVKESPVVASTLAQHTCQIHDGAIGLARLDQALNDHKAWAQAENGILRNGGP